MPIDTASLRALVGSTQANLRVNLDQGSQTSGITAEKSRFDGGRFFRSAEATAQNKAQYQSLLTLLRQDPQIGRSEAAVQDAFAAVRKQADRGEPLTTRLVARALRAGDQRLVQGLLHTPNAPLSAALQQVGAFAQERVKARLTASSGQIEASASRFDQKTADRIGHMDNKALLGLMRTLQSTDAIAYRIGLAQAASDPANVVARDLLEGLNAFEGHVLDAFATRVAPDASPRTREAGDLSAGALTALAGQSQRDFKGQLAEQPDAFLAGRTFAAQQVVQADGARRLQAQGLDPVALRDAVRAAPLTINFKTAMLMPVITYNNGEKSHSFVKEDGTLNDAAMRVKNVFELPGHAKSEAYKRTREVVERHQFPELAAREDAAGFRAADRPVYAGVNVSREQEGAASVYGSCFFVLNDSVKDRALYAPSDTFFAFNWKMTEDRVDAFQQAVANDLAQGDGGFSPKLRAAVAKDPALLQDLRQQLMQAVQSGVGGSGRGSDVNTWMRANIKELHSPQGNFKLSAKATPDLEVLVSFAIKHFSDARPQAATVDHVDRLFQHLSDEQIKTLKQVQGDPLAINAGLADYLEAQIFGGVDFRTDVAELHIILPSRDPAQLRGDDADAFARATQLAESIGARFVVDEKPAGTGKLPQKLDPASAEGQTRLAEHAAREAASSQELSATAAFPRTSAVESNPAHSLTRQGGLKAFREHHLGAAMEAARQQELSFDPGGRNGRDHLGRSLILANVMANVLADAGATLDRHGLYTTVALHDAGRQGAGVDVWQAQSAREAVRVLGEQGLGDPDYLARATAAIDPPAGQPLSLEAVVLKSADAVEGLALRGDFDTSQVGFMRGTTRAPDGLAIPASPDFREGLLREMADFVRTSQWQPASQGALNAALGELALSEARGDDTAGLEALRGRVQTLMDQVSREEAVRHADQNHEARLQSLEQLLRSQPERFPLMNRHYDAGR